MAFFFHSVFSFSSQGPLGFPQPIWLPEQDHGVFAASSGLSDAAHSFPTPEPPTTLTSHPFH